MDVLPLGAAAEARARVLCEVSLAGLARMIDPATGLCVARLATDELYPVGASLRETAAVLLGLERAERAGYPIEIDVGRLYDAVELALAGAEDAGDVGLVLWAAASTSPPLAERALRELADFDDVYRFRTGEEVHTTELAWVVTGLAEALARGIGPERDVRRRLDRAYAWLLGQRGASGLFCRLRAPHRPHGVRGQLGALVRSELGLFDAQVHAIGACLARDAAIGDPVAREVARQVGERLLAHQHPLGQWGSRYNVRTGALVDLYPVYASHQDGIAPLALLPLERAAGLPARPAVARGLSWLFGDNELGDSLVDEERGVVWRSIRRRLPQSAVVYALEAAGMLGLGRGLDLGGRFGGRSDLEIDRECRPHQLGFCLYALADRATSSAA